MHQTVVVEVVIVVVVVAVVVVVVVVIVISTGATVVRVATGVVGARGPRRCRVGQMVGSGETVSVRIVIRNSGKTATCRATDVVRKNTT